MGLGFCVRHSGDRSRHSCFSGGGCLHTRKPFLRSGHQLIEPSSDARLGSGGGTSGKAGSDSLRQRSGADQSTLPELVRGTQDSADPHSARTADAERSRGELQRPPAGRVLERKLVSQSDGRSGEDQRLARRVQWRTASQQSGLSDAKRVRGDLEILSYDWLKKSRHIWTRPGLQDLADDILGKTASIYPASKVEGRRPRALMESALLLLNRSS